MILRSGRYLIALFLLAASLGPNAAEGQSTGNYTLLLRGVPLPEALESLVRETEIDLVYSSDLMSDAEIYCVRRNTSVEALLQCVLEDTGLEYIRSLSGAYVLIPSVRQPSQYGSLAGVILDEATGAPLPYANVFLAEAGTGAAANEVGLFTVSPLVSGPYRIVVTYVGYHTAVDTVLITPGGRHRVRVPMRSAESTLSPVVVDGLEQRLPSRQLGAETLGLRDAEFAGSIGGSDVARAAASLPGVWVQRPLADLHIQGGSAGAHVVLLDGAPVRDPVSLGRHLSAFSPLALGRMSVHRAGFGADKPSNLTGVLTLDHHLAPSGPAELQLSLDPISLNGRISGRIDDGKGSRRATGMVAVRQSVWDIYQEPYVDRLVRQWHAVDPLLTSLWIDQPVTPQSMRVLQQQPDVHFSDLHAALRLQPSPFRTLDASVYRARNRLGSNFVGLNDPGQGHSEKIFATDDLYDWTNYAAQLRYSRLMGARTLLALQGLGSWHRSRYTYGVGISYAGAPEGGSREVEMNELLREATTNIISDESNQVRELTLRPVLQQSISRHSHVEAGLALTHVQSRFNLGSPFVDPLFYSIQAWHFSGHLQARLEVGPGNVVEPGVRVTYVPGRETLYAEPRLALRFDRQETAVGGVGVRIAGGLYRQFVNEFHLSSVGATAVVPFLFFWLPVGADVAPPRAMHLSADAAWMPTTQWTMNVSVYQKWQPRMLVLDYPSIVSSSVQTDAEDADLRSEDDLIATGAGEAFGAEVRLAYERRLFALSGGYAFSHVRRRIPSQFEGRSHAVPWNLPHQWSAQARIGALQGLSAEAGLVAGFGRRWEFRESYYNYLPLRFPTETYQPLALSDPGAAVVPGSMSIDAGIRYRTQMGGGRIELRTMVLNVLDRHDLYDRSAYSDGTALIPTERRLPGRSLLMALRVQR